MIKALLNRTTKICLTYLSQSYDEKQRCKDSIFLLFDTAIEFLNEAEIMYPKLESVVRNKAMELSPDIPELITRYPQLFVL